jgi:predicted MPP superfamily phosphohydrolase
VQLVTRVRAGRVLQTADPAGSSEVLVEAPAGPSEAPASDVADPGRRLFLGRSLAGVAGVAALGTVGFGIRTATGSIPVKRVSVTLKRLPDALDGFTIALLSDIHLGHTAKRAFLDGVVRTVNGLDAGLVAIVGDLVDGDVAELGDDAAGLRSLESRHGTYFVTGNHEYISGAAQWVDYLPSLGVRVLRNERETITEAGASFSLAGVDDRTAAFSGEPGHATDFDAALAGRDSSAPVILLAHQPILFAEAARREVDLQLSGHTHGGQMVPFNYLVRLDQPTVAGLSRVGGSQLYVSRGVGTWGPPVRVGAPPEVTVVELRAGR